VPREAREIVEWEHVGARENILTIAGHYSVDLESLTTQELPDIGPVRLPVPLTALLGRDAELGDLISLIRRRGVRLVTITGAGGVGKTRLAIEVANRVRDLFPGGQVYYRLSELEDPDTVVPLILRELRKQVAPEATTMAELAECIADRPVLILLNTFEQVIESRPWVAELLEMLPGLTALVTSRLPLGVRGEQQYPLGPLELPQAGMSLDQIRRVPSVELFIERVRAVRPFLELDENSVEDVVAILKELDGLPLAIELAALRTRMFPLRVVRERLDQALDFLAGAPYDLPARLRSMRAAIQWSYDMLRPREQEAFRALSVFAAPFSFEAACNVMRPDGNSPDLEVEMLEVVAHLVDHSLLVPVTLQIGNAGFRMPVTIRALGREKLIEHGERDDVLDRELAFYRDGLEVNWSLIYSPRQAVFVSRLDEHAQNLTTSLTIALEEGKRTESALRVATLLVPYWKLRGRVTEAAGFLEGLLPQAKDAPDAILADALRGLGTLYSDLYQLHEARARLEEAMSLYEKLGDDAGIIDVSDDLGVVAMKLGDFDRARELLDRSLGGRRAAGNLPALATTLNYAGDLAMHDGDLPRAEELYTEAYQIHVSIGNPVGIVCECVSLIGLALVNGGRASILEWYQKGKENARAIGDDLGLAQLDIVCAMHEIRLAPENAKGALKQLADAFAVILSSDIRRLVLESLPMATEASVYLGDDRLAAQIIGSGRPVTGDENGFVWYRGRRYLGDVEQSIRERLGEDEYRRYTTLGSYQSARQSLQAVIELVERKVEAPPPQEELPPEVPASVQLTGRETQVLSLVAQGLSDKDIAARLGISPRTAMTHVSNIMAKMKVHSRSAASEVGIRLGLIEAPREG
jgi:predicted ATPase/DNA-binding CsgD family transcriptional regulator